MYWGGVAGARDGPYSLSSLGSIPTLIDGLHETIWRKCVGIEPTAPTAKRAPSDLKSVRATRPESLPRLERIISAPLAALRAFVTGNP